MPSQYGDPVLGSLTPQLISVQFARRFYSFAFQIPGQHHRAKLWDSPLRFINRSALLFSELFSLLFHVLFFSGPPSPEKEPFLNTRGVLTTRPSLLLIRRSPKSLLTSSFFLLAHNTPKTHPSCLAQGAIVPCPHLDTLVHHATCF
ncbi:hypothetical protein TNCV_909861 [Trichonephila clavipes]|nr:hypothetical protein TNCV_909861 [Trichonephila clavipes]